MGIGLVGAYGVSGAQNALRQMRKDKQEQQDLESLLSQRTFERQMREQDMEQRRLDSEQRKTYQDEQLAQLGEQRQANAELRRQNAAAKLSEDLMPGDVLDPSQREMLTGAGRGSFIEHQDATLPSRSTTGFLRSAPKAGAGGRPTYGGGIIRSTANAGNPEQAVFRGTRSQRAMQSMLQRFPEGSRERTVLEYEGATGRNAPSIFMPPPPREPTPHYQLQQLYENGQPVGAISYNTLTGKGSPMALPEGAGIRAGAQGGRGGIPPRVQNFLLDLRARQPNFNVAFMELQKALATTGPDETFDRIEVANALRQLYALPTGQGDAVDQLLRGGGLAAAPGGSVLTPSAGRGGGSGRDTLGIR